MCWLFVPARGSRRCLPAICVHAKTSSSPRHVSNPAWVVTLSPRMSFADGGQRFHKTKVRETWNGEIRTGGGPREVMMLVGGRPRDWMAVEDKGAALLHPLHARQFPPVSFRRERAIGPAVFPPCLPAPPRLVG